MPSVDVNYWAVIVAALVNMVVGSIWYSKGFFGKTWSKLVGRSMEDMSGSGSSYALTAVGALVQAYILSHFVSYTGATSVIDGLQVGLWLWLGFVAVTIGVNTIFEGRSWKLWRINTGYFLVVLAINGALLATWR